MRHEIQASQRLRTPRRPAGSHLAARSRADRRRPAPGAARRHRLGQDLHDGEGDRAAQSPRDRAGAQQDARRAALSRVQIVLSAERRRIFRQLLRLLPARSLRPFERHLHRKRIHDQRRARQAAHERHALAVRAPRRDHRRVRLLHLRHRLARSVLRHDADARKGPADRARSHSAQAGGNSVRALRGSAPRHVPRARRHDRNLSAVRRSRRAHRDVGQPGRSDSQDRSAHRRNSLARRRNRRACRSIRRRTTCCPPRRKSAPSRPSTKSSTGGRPSWSAGENRRGAARGAAHAFRHRDDAHHRLLPRHRELFAAHVRPPAGRSAAHAARLRPVGFSAVRRRIAPDHPAASRHVLTATVRASRRWWITASACPRRSTIAR